MGMRTPRLGIGRRATVSQADNFPDFFDRPFIISVNTRQ